MADDLRISVDALRKRMESGEDFTMVDTRNPQAWAQSNEKLPEAVRIPLASADDDQALSQLPKHKPIVAYCT